MLFEYAVSPDSLYEISKTRRDFSQFIKEFGIGKTKVISEFPKFKRYRKLAKVQFPKCDSDIHQARLEELITFFERNLKVQRFADYNGNLSWDANVNNEHLRVPFDELLRESTNANVRSLSLNNFCGGTDDIGKAETSVVVERQAPKMCSTLRGMLRLSQRIILIDPYWDDHRRYWSPLSDFIRTSLENRPGGHMTIEILYSDGSERQRQAAPSKPSDLIKVFKDKFPELDKQCTISFISFSMPEGKPHNRYLLTDIGGILSGSGFSESQDQPNDDFTLLGEKAYQHRWNEYANGTGYKTTECACNISP